MDAFLANLQHTLRLFAIYEVNGALALLYVMWERVTALLTTAAFVLLIRPAPAEQRVWMVASGALAVLAALLVPPPIPLIITVMALAGVGAVYFDRFSPDALRWRVTGSLGMYALAALGYLAYSQYLAGVDAMTWAKTLGGQGEAAAALARGRSFVDTLATWGLWLIIPLGYFALLVQGVFIHPPGPGRPDDLITTVRTRGME